MNVADTTTTLGVVPIFVNAGAAVLPTILAGLGSVLAFVLRPKDLVRTWLRRPHVPFLVVGWGLALWSGGSWIAEHFQAAPTARSASGEIDWAEVARSLAAGDPPAATDRMPPQEGPVFFRQGNSRCGWDNNPVPANLRATPQWTYTESEAMFLSSPAVAGPWVYAASCVLDAGANYGVLTCLDAMTGGIRWSVDAITDPATGKEEELKGFFSSPAVTSDGRYVVIGQGLHEDFRCSLLCFKADSGELHWRIRTPLHIEGSPAIWGDVAVVGAGSIEGRDGKPVGDPGFVLGVRISDGTILWKQAVNDPESSPVISDDGVAYIGSGLNGSELVAIRAGGDLSPEVPSSVGQDEDPGEVAQAGGKPPVLPSVAGGLLLAGAVIGGGAMLARRRADGLPPGGLRPLVLPLSFILAGLLLGNAWQSWARSTPATAPEPVLADRVLWRQRTPFPATGSVALRGDMVVIGCGKGDFVYQDANPEGVVVAFDRRDGRELWQVKTPDCVLGPVALGTRLAVCPVRNGEVIAIDLAKAAMDIPDERKIAWRRRVSGNAAILAGVALTDAHVYAVSSDGYLAVLDAVTGELAGGGRLYINDEAQPGKLRLSVSSPVLAGGRLFVGSETGGLRCYVGGAQP